MKYCNWLCNILGDFKEKLTKLRQTIAQSRESKGQFEWVDGIFVNALKKGHWLLIENVNFCRYTKKN